MKIITGRKFVFLIAMAFAAMMAHATLTPRSSAQQPNPNRPGVLSALGHRFSPRTVVPDKVRAVNRPAL